MKEKTTRAVSAKVSIRFISFILTMFWLLNMTTASAAPQPIAEQFQKLSEHLAPNAAEYISYPDDAILTLSNLQLRV